MNSAIWFLYSRSFCNSLMVRARRLKQPKYLAGLLLGLLWFGTTFGAMIFRSSHRAPSASPAAEAFLALAGGASFALLLVLAWIRADGKGGLTLDETEATWLFSSPVSRMSTVFYQFAKIQLGIVITSTLISLGLRSSLASGQHLFSLAFGIVLMWNLIMMHRLAVELLYQKFSSRKWVVGVLKIVASSYIATLLALVAVMVFIHFKTGVRSGFETSAAAEAFSSLVWPFRQLMSPLFASTWQGFWASLIPLGVVMAILLTWIIKCNVPWEEATIDQSKRREERLAAIKRGEWRVKKSQPRKAEETLFALSPVGPPSPAFVWSWGIKIGGAKTLWKRFFNTLAVIIILYAGFWVALARLGNSKHLELVVSAPLLYIGLLIPVAFVIPARVAQQFRSDLDHLDFILTMPVTPRQLLQGVLVGPVASAIVYAWMILATLAAILITGASYPQLNFSNIAAGCIGAGMIMTVLIPTLTIIHCLLVILFPGWQPRQRKQSIENMGVGLIAALMIISMLIMTLGVVGVICWLGLKFFVASLSVPGTLLAASTVSTIIIALEGWAAFAWATSALRKYDASEKTLGVRKKRG